MLRYNRLFITSWSLLLLLLSCKVTSNRKFLLWNCHCLLIRQKNYFLLICLLIKLLVTENFLPFSFYRKVSASCVLGSKTSVNVIGFRSLKYPMNILWLYLHFYGIGLKANLLQIIAQHPKFEVNLNLDYNYVTTWMTELISKLISFNVSFSVLWGNI